MIDIAEAQPGFVEDVPNGIRRESSVVFLAREALFLRCGDDRAVHDKCRSTVVIKGREPEDGRH